MSPPSYICKGDNTVSLHCPLNGLRGRRARVAMFADALTNFRTSEGHHANERYVTR